MDQLFVVCFIAKGSGNVYTFGGGQYGQLGCGERQVSESTQVESKPVRSIKRTHCATGHVLHR